VVLSEAAARALNTPSIIGRSIETPAGEWSEVIGVVRTRQPERPVLTPEANAGFLAISTRSLSFLPILPSEEMSRC